MFSWDDVVIGWMIPLTNGVFGLRTKCNGMKGMGWFRSYVWFELKNGMEWFYSCVWLERWDVAITSQYIL